VVTSVSKERIASIFGVEVDGGSTLLKSVGNHLQDYMVSQPKRPHLTSSLLCKPEILNIVFLCVSSFLILSNIVHPLTFLNM
jgi:hypothetical protein